MFTIFIQTSTDQPTVVSQTSQPVRCECMLVLRRHQRNVHHVVRLQRLHARTLAWNRVHTSRPGRQRDDILFDCVLLSLQLLMLLLLVLLMLAATSYLPYCYTAFASFDAKSVPQVWRIASTTNNDDNDDEISQTYTQKTNERTKLYIHPPTFHPTTPPATHLSTRLATSLEQYYDIMLVRLCDVQQHTAQQQRRRTTHQHPVSCEYVISLHNARRPAIHPPGLLAVSECPTYHPLYRDVPFYVILNADAVAVAGSKHQKQPLTCNPPPLQRLEQRNCVSSVPLKDILHRQRTHTHTTYTCSIIHTHTKHKPQKYI